MALVRATGNFWGEAAVLLAMHRTTRSPRSFWRKWPATTIMALAGVTALALVVANRSPTNSEEMTDEEARPVHMAAKSAPAVEPAPVPAPAPARPEEMSDKSEPPAGVREMDAGHFLASPYGGAFAVGTEDADVWGGLTGTEVGEAYGVGGLGLVGTGKGGGGRGSGVGAGYGRGAGTASRGRYDEAMQSRVMTVGTVDDNADAKAYATALERLGVTHGLPGIEAEMWQMAPPKQRHVAQPRSLDVALVIDTTGSMGDELEYLKVELRDIATRVARSYPGVTQRWGMVLYRDHGDAYVTRKVDFSDIDSFITKLGQQSAGGGGDTPEAMDLGMVASAELAWRTGEETARMVFLVADAPTHQGAGARRFASAVLEHRAAGTAIYPVGASGVDNEAEAEMRLAAKVTGGQYIFLTDHSGVGGHHAAPKVEQYKVETLHDAMARMIGGELGGADVAEVADVADVAVPVLDMPVPVQTADESDSDLVPAIADPPELGVWESIRERLADPLMFALGMLMMVLAGVGFDTLLHRWRTR